MHKQSACFINQVTNEDINEFRDHPETPASPMERQLTASHLQINQI